MESERDSGKFFDERFKMADISASNRRLLEISICALLREQGFSSASKIALETLTEMLQSYISELGHSCKLSCELSARVKPTLSDVKVALIDMGADLDSLPSYGKRANRIHVNNPLKSRIAPPPKSLAAGTRQARPAHIPPHLPPLPDPHSYIKTPAFRQSSKEYQAVREKYAAQRKEIEEGLSKFLAKTAELSSGICEGLDAPSFPLLVNELNDLPYLSAVGDFDETELQEHNVQVDKESPSNGMPPGSTQNTDSFDNPYLRPAKRSRKVLKPS